MARCIVHDPPPADYDSRHYEGDFLPSLEDLEHELYVHLQGLTGEGPPCSINYCGHCYEEYMVRTNGMEELLLEEDHAERMAAEHCTCPSDSPNREYFLQSIRRAYQGALT